MDGDQFDALAKAFAHSVNRRAAVRRIAGSLAGATLALAGLKRNGARGLASLAGPPSAHAQDASQLTVQQADGATYGQAVSAANTDRSFKLLRQYLHKQGFAGGGDLSVYLVFADGTLLRTVTASFLSSGDEVAALTYGVEADGTPWRYAIVYQGYQPLYHLAIGSNGEIVKTSFSDADVPASGGVRAMPAALLADAESCQKCDFACEIIATLGCQAGLNLVLPLVCGPAALACSAIVGLLLDLEVETICYLVGHAACPEVCKQIGYCTPPGGCHPVNGTCSTSADCCSGAACAPSNTPAGSSKACLQICGPNQSCPSGSQCYADFDGNGNTTNLICIPSCSTDADCPMSGWYCCAHPVGERSHCLPRGLVCGS